MKIINYWSVIFLAFFLLAPSTGMAAGAFCPDGSYSTTGVCPGTTSINEPSSQCASNEIWVNGKCTLVPTAEPVRGGAGGQSPTSYSETIRIPNPLKTDTITDLIDRIASWLLFIGAPILTLMVIIGAFQILTAAGKEEQITLGRKTITYAVVGYLLLLLSSGISKIIAEFLGAK